MAETKFHESPPPLALLQHITNSGTVLKGPLYDSYFKKVGNTCLASVVRLGWTCSRNKTSLVYPDRNMVFLRQID